MSSSDPSNAAESLTKITVTQLLPTVYQDALQPGVKQIGMALESVLSLVPTLMLPFKYISEAAKLRLSTHLDKLRKQLEEKKPEDVRPIAPEIGVPVIEKLLHTQDEQLASLYMRLLAQACDVAGQQFAHPSFPALIANLSPDEAALLQIFVYKEARLPAYPTVHVYLKAESLLPVFLRGPLTGWEEEVKLAFPDNLPSYFANLLRCGILQANRTIVYRYHANKGYTARLEHLQDFYRPAFGQPMQKGTTVEFEPGVVELTEYGQMFINACVVPQPDLLTGVTL